jgi:hypothetical protein|nr:MAG TPA: hypothetical protein [Caudoviricetes sp.]
MEIKVILLITIYLILGILGSILFLRDIYRTYGELTLGDIVTFLVVSLTGPITLLCLLIKHLDRFKILKK